MKARVIALIFLLINIFLQSFAQGNIISIQKHRHYSLHQIDSLIQANSLPAALIPVAYPVTQYRVVYQTMLPDSTLTIATGAMIVPDSTTCAIPLVSYQHGTIAKKTSAPSYFRGSEVLIGTLGASTGYLMNIPDYIGLGDGPGMHLYQHAQSEAQAVIDMLLAAREFADSTGIRLNDQLFLFGYSQGGHATLATHKYIQLYYDDVFTVTASAPMSGAYDMSGVMVDLMLSDDPYSNPAYLPYVLLSYHEVYGNLYDTSLSEAILPPYDTMLYDLFDGTHSIGYINSLLPQVPKYIIRPEVLDSFMNDTLHPLRIDLKDNDLHDWVPLTPVKMIYCENDELVPYENSLVAQQRFEAQGSTVTEAISAGAQNNHFDCAQPAIMMALSWLNSLKDETDSMKITFIKGDVTNPGNPDGFAIAHVEPDDGRYIYQFQWSTGSTDSMITGLLPGTYHVTVTNQYGCSISKLITISVATHLPATTDHQISIYPVPSRDFIELKMDKSIRGLQIKLYAPTGQILRNWVLDVIDQVRLDLTGIRPGVYFLELGAGPGYRQPIIIY